MSSSNDNQDQKPENSSIKNSLVVIKPKKKVVFSDYMKHEEALEEQRTMIHENETKIQEIEDELKKLKKIEQQLGKQIGNPNLDSINKQKVKNTTSKSKKKSSKKPSKPKILENQKHTVVPLSYFDEPYSISKRRKDWYVNAGHNETQLVCSKCKDDDNWETILLENGNHLCYYCWIKKPKSKKKINSSKRKTSSIKLLPLSTKTNSLVVVKPKKSNRKSNQALVPKQSKSQNVSNNKKNNYEKIYPIELDTLRTAFQVLPRPVQKEYEKRIYDMIDSLIEKKFIVKRH